MKRNFVVCFIFLFTVTALFSQEADAGVYIKELSAALDKIPVSKPDKSELDYIGFVYEKEKLTRDIYYTLYKIHGYSVFKKIQDDEEMHMKIVKLLIDRYGIKINQKLDIGQFQDPENKKIYDEYTKSGNVNYMKGIEVSITIEELDVLKIDEAIQRIKSPDINFLLINLLISSKNHVRLFSSEYKRYGQKYKNVWLPDAIFTEITTSKPDKLKIIYEQ